MMWQKLVVEWPAQIWRLIWDNKSAPLRALLEKITWRKIVFFAALLVATIALAQLFSLDLAFLMAGDVAFYCEIAAAVMFIVVRGHIRHSVRTAKLALAQAMQRARIWCRRPTGTRRRSDIKGPIERDKGADEDGGWLPEFTAFALQT